MINAIKEPKPKPYLDPETGEVEEMELEGEDALAFSPVQLRFRQDGWTPARQEDFIHAIAETGCVEHACAAVGMSTASAYKLRMRPEADSFRIAWEAALDCSAARLSDALFARAIHGEVVPHYYQGERVGEHRRYDNRLAMWLLRHRDPVRYGAWRDRREFRQHPEGPFVLFMHRVDELVQDCWGFLKTRMRVWKGAPDELGRLHER